MKFQAFIKKLLAFLKKAVSSSAFTNTFFAISSGVLVGFVIMLLTASSLSNAVNGLFRLLTGGFQSPSMLGNVLFSAAPLILVGLSVAFAFKTGLFNIGASGQFMIGGIFALYVANLVSLPPVLHFIVAALAAIVGGAIWGFIPGLLKVKYNVNEVITCIMLNYVAAYTSVMAVENPLVYDSGITAISISFPTAEIPRLGLNQLFPGSYIDMSILIAIAVAILIWFILKKTTLGYQLKAVGFSKDASKYAGIPVSRNMILSMMIAGGLAGLAAAMNYLPANPDYFRSFSQINPIGFEGISIALIAQSHPIGIIFSGIFISFIKKGALLMQFFGFNKEITSIIMSVIIYMISISAFVGQFIKKRKLMKKQKSKLVEERGDANV
jgi:general nucleoside transport system permease protein